MLRSILYVSQLVSPDKSNNWPDLIKTIQAEAEKANEFYEITAILSFKQGWFIQLFEGESEYVETLYQNIKKDPRHTSVRTLLDIEVEERINLDYPIAVVESLEDIDEFATYLARNIDIITELDEDRHRFLEFFFLDDVEI